MTQTLWLVDNSLRAAAGHPLEYARVVADEAKRRGIKMQVIAHAAMPKELAPDLQIRPAIRHMFFDRFNSSGPLLRLGRIGIAADFLKANREFRRDLNAALSRVASEDIVFAPSVDHRQLLAWAGWLRSVPRSRRPKAVVLMMRYNYRDGLDHALNPYRKMIVRGLAAVQKVQSAGLPVRMTTDSERLAAEYQEYAPGLAFEVFPIPHTSRAADAASRSSRTPGKPVRIVAVGDARMEKGYDLLLAAIRTLATFSPEKLEGMEFAIQCPIMHVMNEPVRAELEELRAMALPNVDLIERVLSSDEYADLIGGADLVTLPYRKQQYDARTSGPLAEAFAAGKPAVVTRDTWLGDQLDRHGAGFAIRDGDIVGLASAIAETRDRIAVLSEQAKSRQPAWLALHNPATFVEMLLNGCPKQS